MQSKNLVAPSEVSCFFLISQDGGEKISANQERKATAFISCLGHSGFKMTLHGKDAKSAVSILKSANWFQECHIMELWHRKS